MAYGNWATETYTLRGKRWFLTKKTKIKFAYNISLICKLSSNIFHLTDVTRIKKSPRINRELLVKSEVFQVRLIQISKFGSQKS